MHRIVRAIVLAAIPCLFPAAVPALPVESTTDLAGMLAIPDGAARDRRELAALKRALAPGAPAAATEAWFRRLAAARALPLAVTRTDAVVLAFSARPVLFAGEYAGHARQLPMLRLGSSSVWALHLSLPADALLRYRLVDAASGEAAGDPGNPLRVVRRGGSRVDNWLAMPDAPWPALVAAASNLRPLRVDTYTLTNPAPAFSRTVRVLTPPGYVPAKGPYRLLVLHDGHMWMKAGLERLYAAMLAAGRAPACVLVLVDNAGRWRGHEFIPPALRALDGRFGGGGREDGMYAPSEEMPDAYAAFIVKTVLPFVEKRYAVSRRRADRVLSGSSNGGPISVHVANLYPGAFGGIGVQSIIPVHALAARGLRVWASQGLWDLVPVDSFRAQVAGRLAPAAAVLRVNVFSGGHHAETWASEMPAMLRFLWDLP